MIVDCVYRLDGHVIAFRPAGPCGFSGMKSAVGQCLASWLLYTPDAGGPDDRMTELKDWQNWSAVWYTRRQASDASTG